MYAPIGKFLNLKSSTVLAHATTWLHRRNITLCDMLEGENSVIPRMCVAQSSSSKVDQRSPEAGKEWVLFNGIVFQEMSKDRIMSAVV